MEKQRVLPADAYDAMELSAMAFGGIGLGRVWDSHHRPVCAYGHAAFACDVDNVSNPIFDALRGAGIDSIESDKVVRRLAGSPTARVPFTDWCAELGVVRGDS